MTKGTQSTEGGKAERTGQIRRLNPGPRLADGSVYGGIVYLAGQVPEKTADQDLKAQTREVLDTIDQLLAEAGSDKTRILRAQIFLTDIAQIAQMNEVWDAWVAPGEAPARATVQAALARPGWKIEVVVTAACG